MKHSMKKAAAGILAAAIVSTIGVTSAFASGHGCGRNFVDADGNGVCDCAGTYCRYIDSDRDGVCDHYAQGHGRGFGCGRN